MYNCPMRFWLLHSVIAPRPHGFGPAGGVGWGEVRGLRGAVGCAGGCQRRRDPAGGCWWFCLAQIYVQTPPGSAQRARSPGNPGLMVVGRQQQAEGWLGQKALLCSMPSVVPRGTWPGPMAVSWPAASLGAARTSPTRLAVSVPNASAVSAVSRVVGWGVGQGGARNGRCWWS